MFGIVFLHLLFWTPGCVYLCNVVYIYLDSLIMRITCLLRSLLVAFLKKKFSSTARRKRYPDLVSLLQINEQQGSDSGLSKIHSQNQTVNFTQPVESTAKVKTTTAWNSGSKCSGLEMKMLRTPKAGKMLILFNCCVTWENLKAYEWCATS